MQQIELTGDLLERMAAAAHEVFCEDLRAKGYEWGPQTNEARKTHSALKPYAELPEEERVRDDGPAAKAFGQGVLPQTEKEKDRNLVRGIPKILAEAGYTIVKVTENPKEATRAGEGEG